MQIKQHNLQSTSERSYSRSESEQTALRVGRVSTDSETGNRRVDVVFETSAASQRELNTYSAMALRAQAASPASSATDMAGKTQASSIGSIDDPQNLIQTKDRLKLELIVRLHKAITGKEIKVMLINPDQLRTNGGHEPAFSPDSVSPSSPPVQSAIGVELEHSQTIRESEQTRFAVNGRIQTRDGQTIDLEIELNMARSVSIEQHQMLRLGARLSDPLVLNFDGKATELSNTRFKFDLDLDGKADDVPTLAGQSAFLVLDRNGDGQINDGREMFGALSGNGFVELSEYDSDGNGFIDEGDSIFSHLRLWSPTADGQGQLMTLGSSNVGAIWLHHSSTEFSLTPDLEENRLGVIRSSSIYLSEDGQVGTVQQLDLSI